MRHFKTAGGHIRAIEDGQEGLIASDWQEMSEAEVQAELNPPLSISDLAARKRHALENGRKAAEAVGIKHNDIRYSGDPENRQAIREALEAAEDAGMEAFNRWKDSEAQFHLDHPVSDVWAALRAIATRRSDLINREGELVTQIDVILADDQLSDEEKRQQLEAIEWSEE